MHRQYPRPVQLRGRVVKSHTSEFGRVAAAFAELAETEGFEPSVREFPVRRFSKPLVSATHPRLRMRSAQTVRGTVEHEQLRAAAIEGRFPGINRNGRSEPNPRRTR